MYCVHVCIIYMLDIWKAQCIPYHYKKIKKCLARTWNSMLKSTELTVIKEGHNLF